MEKIQVKELANKRIIEFLKANTALALATCKDNVPHCANCFYVYDEELNLLIFKSRPGTRHIHEALVNNNVAGTILPDKLEPTKIQGIQFSGYFSEPKDELLQLAKTSYYKRYPFAIAFPGNLWIIELDNIKMTDNSLGFGTKIEWPERVQ